MSLYNYGVYVFQLLCLAGEAIQATVKIMRLPNDKALPEGGRPDRVRQPWESIGMVGLCCGVPAAACKYL